MIMAVAENAFEAWPIEEVKEELLRRATNSHPLPSPREGLEVRPKTRIPF
jgi:hypothetical protein